MEKIKQRFFWLAVLVGASGIGYLLANNWGKIYGAINVRFSFEERIPFVPNAIFVYLLVFTFLLMPVFIVRKYADFIEVLAIYALLVAVSLATFFAFPTTMERPHAPDFGFVGWLFGAVRAIDGPNNLFPSLHVSSVVYVAFVNGYFCPKAKWISWICAILVSVSTLLVKQHALVDVFGGAVLGATAFVLLWVLRRKE